MKPWLDGFVVVTGTTDLDRDLDCLQSWTKRATYRWELIVVHDGHNGVFRGSVPVFAEGVQRALGHGAQVVACLHSDVRIDEDGWDARVWEHFQQHPKCGLAGFGGALGLGSDDIYQTEYTPQQLARQGFLSNMQDAEAHGARETKVRRAVCFDGFCQIGRAEFWAGHPYLHFPPLDYIVMKGVKHHAYDSWLGALAHRMGFEAWLIPVACHHFGGRVAVGDQKYAAWAYTQDKDGDHGFWEAAHKAFYNDCRGELPLRVAE